MDKSEMTKIMQADAEACAKAAQIPRTYIEDRNCLSWWFPRIQGAGLPVPKTRLIVTEVRLLELVDGKTPPGFARFLELLLAAINDVGYPAFLRTGQGSGKHQWEDTCFIADEQTNVGQHVANLVEWSAVVDMMGLDDHVWAVREYLPVQPLYHCTRFCNMPVVREWRAFVDGERVAYANPYWPEDALAQGAPDCDTWADSYDGDFAASRGTLHRVRNLASAAGVACGGRWSVDILETKAGLYVTDMAIAERSYGYDAARFRP